MSTDQETVRRAWRIPDELGEGIEPLLPPRKPHPLGCHRPRVDDRQAMEAICFVLRTGCPWNALHDTSRCASSAAHRRFQAWAAAGIVLELWTRGLVAYEAVQGIDGEGLAMDGARPKAPLGGENGGQKSDRPWEDWHHTARPHRRRRHPQWSGRGGSHSA